MLIGAHVSSSGGVINAIKNANKLEVEALQTFLSAPQSFKITEYSEEKVQQFLEEKSKNSIKNYFAHAIYLLNFASEKPSLVELSKQNLIATLNLSAKLKFSGVIIHLGSSKESVGEGIKQVALNLNEVLSQTDESSTLYLENSAGAGNNIGSSFDHIVEILNLTNSNNRVKVCLDTQHMFASGYDVKTRPTEIVDEILSKFGEKFSLVHLNDSKTELNSKKDRHENIGEGLIGSEGLKAFLTDHRLMDRIALLEVPGFEKKGPDKINIDRVNSFFN